MSKLQFVFPESRGWYGSAASWYFILGADIRLDGDFIGQISPGNKRDENLKMVGVNWLVRFMVKNPNFEKPEKVDRSLPFRWKTLPERFDTPEDAIEFFKKSWEELQTKFEIFKESSK